MSPTCIDVDRIADVESSPEGHPLRQHVAECPRCQSLWLSYQSFMKADVSGAPDIEAARKALAETIRQKAGVAAAPRASRLARRPPWYVWLRPGLIAAMASLLTILAVSIWRGGGPDEPMLRGDDDAVWLLQSPQLSGESIVLEWKPVPDADAYDVQIFDDALNEVYTSGALTTTTTTIPRESMPSVAAGESVTWRVVALRGGDVVSTSPPASLTLP
jgi:hypothetical protein